MNTYRTLNIQVVVLLNKIFTFPLNFELNFKFLVLFFFFIRINFKFENVDNWWRSHRPFPYLSLKFRRSYEYTYASLIPTYHKRSVWSFLEKVIIFYFILLSTTVVYLPGTVPVTYCTYMCYSAWGPLTPRHLIRLTEHSEIAKQTFLKSTWMYSSFM